MRDAPRCVASTLSSGQLRAYRRSSPWIMCVYIRRVKRAFRAAFRPRPPPVECMGRPSGSRRRRRLHRSHFIPVWHGISDDDGLASSDSLSPEWRSNSAASDLHRRGRLPSAGRPYEERHRRHLPTKRHSCAPRSRGSAQLQHWVLSRSSSLRSGAWKAPRMAAAASLAVALVRPRMPAESDFRGVVSRSRQNGCLASSPSALVRRGRRVVRGRPAFGL